jgi:O-antigen/teichoic acid export membrane protein
MGSAETSASYERERPDAAAAGEPRPPSPIDGKGALKRLALRGSAFEFLGYGTSMVLRLGTNVVMSRLLFPDAFGLAALVMIFTQGLIMLSDVGIEPAVIQSEHGDEVGFLNTAWTMQAIRGIVLYVIVLALAWPFAVLYREPQLFGLTCVAAIGLVLQGFTSTSILTLRRRLSIGTINAIEIASQVAAIAVMIPWAFLRPSVWPLVGGHVVSCLFKLVASHFLEVGYRNRFARDPAARKAIVHFGKWVFLSSAFFFLGRQADRLILGRLLSVAELGIYSIAVLLGEAGSTVATRIAHGVLFPVLSRVRLEGQERLRQVYYRARLFLDALFLPALGLLTMLAPWLIHLVYDRRYEAAGWMLQFFAVRVAMYCVLTPCETLLVALGMSRYGFYQNAVRLAWMAAVVPVAWHFLGLRGIVWAVTTSEVPLFLVLWPGPASCAWPSRRGGSPSSPVGPSPACSSRDDAAGARDRSRRGGNAVS